MPFQKIHAGRTFQLVPMGSMTSSDDMTHKVTPQEILDKARETGDYSSFAYEYGPLNARTEGDGIIQSEEPSAYIHWSKGRDGNGEDPGDQGFAQLSLEVDVEWLERLLQQHRLQVANATPQFPAPTKLSIMTSSLSWRDLNTLRVAAKDARDGAFGNPE